MAADTDRFQIQNMFTPFHIQKKPAYNSLNIIPPHQLGRSILFVYLIKEIFGTL